MFLPISEPSSSRQVAAECEPAGHRDPPAGYHGRQDPHVTCLGARCPWLQRELAQAPQLGRVGHFDGLAADENTPAGASRSIDLIDLERDPAAAASSVEL